MGTTWVGALRRAATALGRRHRVSEGEGTDVSDESGFTLIELMVVLLIMGILMAIAIPTFLGVTSTANDRSTQSNLTNALTASKAIYAAAQGFPATTVIVKKLKSNEPEFSYTTGASTKQATISVKVTKTTLWLAAKMTKTTVCWQVKDVETGSSAGVSYGYVTGTTCSAGGTFKASGTKWPTAPTGK